MNKILLILISFGFVLIFNPLLLVYVYPDRVSQLDDDVKNLVAVLFFTGTLFLIIPIIIFAVSEFRSHKFTRKKENKK